MVVAALPDIAARKDLAGQALRPSQGRQHAAIPVALALGERGSICGRRLTHTSLRPYPGATCSRLDLVPPHRPHPARPLCLDRRKPTAGQGRGHQIRTRPLRRLALAQHASAADSWHTWMRAWHPAPASGRETLSCAPPGAQDRGVTTSGNVACRQPEKVGAMTAIDSWPVEVSLREAGRETRAEARLTRETVGLVGYGLARRNPDDPEVTQIGEEIAAARALSDLAHQLLSDAAQQIEGITHQRAHLTLLAIVVAGLRQGGRLKRAAHCRQ